MYSRAYVEITNICNRSCSFCPGVARPPRRMSFDEFKKVTGSLVGVTEYLYYHLMGEPLTHPELPNFISYAATLGFKSAVTTNGTLLGRVGDALIDSGVYKVNISLHSFEEGSREDYLDYINTCLDFADKASSCGVLVVFRLWNRGYDKGRNIDTLAMIKERFGLETYVESPKGARIRHRLHIEYGDRFDWPDIEGEYLGDEVFCHGLGDHFAILCDGRVVPCCLDREGVISLGNILEEDIEDILSSERAQNMKNGFSRRYATEELCRRCPYARRFKK